MLANEFYCCAADSTPTSTPDGVSKAEYKRRNSLLYTTSIEGTRDRLLARSFAANIGTLMHGRRSS
jgi:hypothetical protein